MVQLGDMQCFEVSLQPHKFILGHHPSLALQTPFMMHYGSESLGLLQTGSLCFVNVLLVRFCFQDKRTKKTCLNQTGSSNHSPTVPLLVKHQIQGKSREVKEKSAFVYRATFPVFDLLWLLFGSPSFCLSLSSPLPQIIFLLRDLLLQALFFLDWSFLNAACCFSVGFNSDEEPAVWCKQQLNLYLKTHSLRETSFDTNVALM